MNKFIVKTKLWIEEHKKTLITVGSGICVATLAFVLGKLSGEDNDQNETIIKFNRDFVDQLSESRGWSKDYGRQMIQNTTYLEFLIGQYAQTDGYVNTKYVESIAKKHNINNYITVCKGD